MPVSHGLFTLSPPKPANDCISWNSSREQGFLQTTSAFYATVIRPGLEYCAPVWHYAITWSQAEQLESIQKRAIHIIYPFTRGMSYSNILLVAELTSLESRRDQLSRSFFQDISHPSSSLYPLLPLHVIHLSCLGSEQPHGLHVLSHAPKNIVPLLITP